MNQLTSSGKSLMERSTWTVVLGVEAGCLAMVGEEVGVGSTEKEETP